MTWFPLKSASDIRAQLIMLELEDRIYRKDNTDCFLKKDTSVHNDWLSAAGGI